MRHWTDDQIIESIYGIGPADGHLDSCDECRGRRAGMQRRRVEFTEASVPAGVLAAQRRAVYARAEGSGARPAWLRAAVATAGVAALAVGLIVSRPDQTPARPDTTSADAQLIADAWAAVDTEAPRAAQPIYALFEEAQ